MTRAEAECIVVKVQFGAPGEDYDTADGRKLIMELPEQMGVAALTDEAVIRLAGMHLAEEERKVRTAQVAWYQRQRGL